jgi:hypothetical protein
MTTATTDETSTPIRVRCRISAVPHLRDEPHRCERPMPHIDNEAWIAQFMSSSPNVTRDVALQLLALAAVRGAQMRNSAPLSDDPLADPVIDLGADLFLVVTGAESESGEQFRVQVLDVSVSPAVLHVPDVSLDGSRAAAVLAGEDWAQRLRTVEGV